MVLWLQTGGETWRGNEYWPPEMVVTCFDAPETWIISKPETEQMDFIKRARLLFDDDDDGCGNN